MDLLLLSNLILAFVHKCTIDGKFWWDVEGCMAASPKEIVFLVSWQPARGLIDRKNVPTRLTLCPSCISQLEFDITGLIEPTTCQDADTFANALAVAMEVGLDGGDANVTDIGCAT